MSLARDTPWCIWTGAVLALKLEVGDGLGSLSSDAKQSWVSPKRSDVPCRVDLVVNQSQLNLGRACSSQFSRSASKTFGKYLSITSVSERTTECLQRTRRISTMMVSGTWTARKTSQGFCQLRRKQCSLISQKMFDHQSRWRKGRRMMEPFNGHFKALNRERWWASWNDVSHRI